MRPQLYLVLLCMVMLFIFHRMTNFQYQQTELDTRSHPFDSMTTSDMAAARIGYLPHGIVQANSDLDLKPLWLTKSTKIKETDESERNLLAVPVGIGQKRTVDAIVTKFLPENFTIILFHYDGNVNGWHDLEWSNRVIHIAARNQTKWWFAKRFLHPDVVHVYDYIFLWDEDLGVKNFHPGRYLKIMKSEGLEISQPALDPKQSEIHHLITIRREKGNVHRRVISRECSSTNEEPPCTGWVEGMAPVFSRSAWRCAWHLIQNDLIHGWGMDMKLGYCAQGDRTKKVGVIDSEFIVHQGVQTLGGSTAGKPLKEFHRPARRSKRMVRKHNGASKGGQRAIFDARIQIRRRAKSELQNFQRRWDQATTEDKEWIDPFRLLSRRSQSRNL